MASLLGGGTYVERERIADVLNACRRRRDRTRAAPRSPTVRGRVPAARGWTTIARQIDRCFDLRRTAASAARRSSPHAPVSLALELYRRRTETHRDMAISPRSTRWAGGRFTTRSTAAFSATRGARDWQSRTTRSCSTSTRRCSHVYVEAARRFELARFGERAEDVLRYVQTWLADPVDGGWADRSGPTRYYSARRATRQMARPATDRSDALSSWNAAMASPR